MGIERQGATWEENGTDLLSQLQYRPILNGWRDYEQNKACTNATHFTVDSEFRMENVSANCARFFFVAVQFIHSFASFAREIHHLHSTPYCHTHLTHLMTHFSFHLNAAHWYIDRWFKANSNSLHSIHNHNSFRLLFVASISIIFDFYPSHSHVKMI